MRFLKFLTKEDKKKNTLQDLYQESISKLGRDQIKKLVDKGLSIPVVIL